MTVHLTMTEHQATTAHLTTTAQVATSAQVNNSDSRRPRTLAMQENVDQLVFELIGQRHAERARVEETITQRFAQVYGADVRRFMPWQLCVRLTGDIVATLGIRCAESAPLFLENYLDAPIEEMASRVIGRGVERKHIVEIGNLASNWRGASQWLFITLTLLLCEQERPWVTFTATPEVQKLLRRLDIMPVALVHADAERLGDEKERWGSYYEQKPLVMITHAPTAQQKMLQHPLLNDLVAQLTPFVHSVQQQWSTYVSAN